MIVADRDDIETCNSISDIHIKSFKSKEVIVIKDQDYIVFRVLVVPSNSRDSLFLVTFAVCLFPVKEMTQRAISWQTKKTPKLSSISSEFTKSHRVVPRSKLYVPKVSSFPLPLKYIDVMRQTGTDSESAAKHTINFCWNQRWCCHSLR